TAELAELKALWSAAAGRLKIGSNLVLRTAPAYQWLKRAIGEEVLGSLYAFDGDYLYGRLHKISEGWRSGVTNYSVILGGGIHLVDLMLWLTGERPKRASAAGNRISTAVSGGQGYDAVTQSFFDGIAICLACDRAAEQRSPQNIEYV